MCPSPWGLQVVHRPIVRGRFWECEDLTENEIVFMPQKYIDYCGPAQFLICQILTHNAPQWVLACFVLVVPKHAFRDFAHVGFVYGILLWVKLDH